jgi:hypothetical protein
MVFTQLIPRVRATAISSEAAASSKEIEKACKGPDIASIFAYLRPTAASLAIILSLAAPPCYAQTRYGHTRYSPAAKNPDFPGAENTTLDVIAAAVYKKRDRAAVRAYLRSLGARETEIIPTADEREQKTLLFQAPFSRSTASAHPPERALAPDEESCGVEPRNRFELKDLLTQLVNSGYFVEVYPTNAAAADTEKLVIGNGAKFVDHPAHPSSDQVWDRLKELLQKFFNQYALGRVEITSKVKNSYQYEFVIKGVTGLAIPEHGFAESYKVIVDVGPPFAPPDAIELNISFKGSYGSAPFGRMPLRYTNMEANRPDDEGQAQAKLLEFLHDELR